MLQVTHCSGPDSATSALAGYHDTVAASAAAGKMSLHLATAPIVVPSGGDDHSASAAAAVAFPPPDSPRRSSPFFSYVDLCWCCPSCIERRQRAVTSRGIGDGGALVHAKDTGTELLCCHGLPIMNGSAAHCKLCAYGIMQMNNPHLNAFSALPLRFLKNGVSRPQSITF